MFFNANKDYPWSKQPKNLSAKLFEPHSKVLMLIPRYLCNKTLTQEFMNDIYARDLRGDMVPPMTIVAGNPARIIRKIETNENSIEL